MNGQFLKKETPKHRENTQTKTKKKFWKFKENYEWKKFYLTIGKKHRMENSQDGNRNNKSSTNIYTNV